MLRGRVPGVAKMIAGLVWMVVVSAGTGQAAEWHVGDVAITVQDDVELGEREHVERKLPRGTQIAITEVRGPWLGGCVEFEGEKSYGWVHRLEVKLLITPVDHLPPGDDKESALAALKSLGVREELDHEGEVISLDASETRVSDAALAYLRFFTRLSDLQLSGTAIGDEGLAHVGKVKSLERLYLDRTDITDAGVKQLDNLYRLELLVLEGTEVSGAVLNALKDLAELRTLSLSRCRVTDEQLDPCRDMKNLEVLNLSHTQIGGQGLRALQALPRLRVLNLDHTPLDDDHLLELANQPTLKMLHLRHTKVSDETVEQLKATLHSCAVYRR